MSLNKILIIYFIFSHTLKGSSFATSVLRIESDTGKIYINGDNELDYDKVNPIFVQVIATDKVGHMASASLTIDLLDVNNKAPSITSVSKNNDDCLLLLYLFGFSCYNAHYLFSVTSFVAKSFFAFSFRYLRY